MDNEQKQKSIWDKVISQLRSRAEASDFDQFQKLEPKPQVQPDQDKVQEFQKSFFGR